MAEGKPVGGTSSASPRLSYHCLPAAQSGSKAERIIDALERKGAFAVPPPSDNQLPHPAVLFWTRDVNASKLLTEDELQALSDAGRLLSVVVEKVSLPVGLPQHPIVDLVGWKGSLQNPFFIELLGHLEQAAERKAPPHPGNRLSRIRKKLFAGLTFGVVVACIFGVTMNVLGVQNNVCSIDFAQPGLSDFCGGFGLGDKPTRKERLAWEARTPGSCDAIRSHIETFGDKGALHSVAADLLAARRTTTEVYWVDDTQAAPFSHSFATVGAETEAEARTAALSNAGRAAEASCKAYGQGDLYKVKGHKIEVDAWDCAEFSSGHYCGFDGRRICLLERRVEEQREFCG